MTNASFLRRVLWADAATCIACGILLGFGAEALTGLLGLPPALMRWAGISLFPVAGLLVFLATRDRPAPALVWVIIVGNAIWAIDSLILLLTPWVAPTLLGSLFVIGQAVVVFAFARFEHLGLRAAA